MPDLDDDEMTELVDADFPRVDLVGKGANGIPRFLVMKNADGDASGLLEPEFVRDLIAKVEPEQDRRERMVAPNGITVSGSPADIAAFIHKAAERAEAGEVAKAELSGKSRNDLPDSAFAYIQPGGHKDDEGKTTPRKLRHFPIQDEAHVRAALSRIGQGAEFSDEAGPKVRAAARKFGIDVAKKEAAVADPVTKADMAQDLDGGVDGLDPTVPLAEPDGDFPGSGSDPGSPAWEAIDAATAAKWCSILSRARVAVDLLAERELLEAASADPGDAENAWDLQDVCCAIDYAISVLAPFAVAEQSEADCGEDMAAMAKSAAPDPDTWTAIAKAAGSPDLASSVFQLEVARAVIAKSGRVLSSVNEAHIKEAAARLNTVLQSLPQAPAPDGQPVAKMTPAEEADMPEPAPSEAVTAESGQQPAMGVKEQPPAPQKAVDVAKADTSPEPAVPAAEAVVKASALPVGVFDHARRFLGLTEAAAILTDIAKAETGDGKAPMCVVYNQAGKLIGIVDPADITPVANSEAEPDDAPDEPEAAPAADAGDLTPQPPAGAGTPAEDVAKGTQPEAPTQDTSTHDVLKSAMKDVLAELLGAQPPQEDVAKQADVAGMRERLEEMAARLETVEKQDARPGVFANGAVPPPGSVPPPRPSLRGQDQGAAQPVDVAKNIARKQEMYTADPADANRIHNEMQADAIAALAAIQRR